MHQEDEVKELTERAITAIKRLFKIHGIEGTEDALKIICKHNKSILDFHMFLYDAIKKGEL